MEELLDQYLSSQELPNIPGAGYKLSIQKKRPQIKLKQQKLDRIIALKKRC